ncbi:unnamed protein product, partial [Rotaria sp. Silwood1]
MIQSRSFVRVGITSFGKGCAVAGDPGIYTRLASYHHWIRSIVNDNDVRPPISYTCDNTKVYCGCSLKNVELTPSRIVGGEEAVPYTWSFMVSLQHRSSNSHFCGGSIFSDSYILTAAHCVDDETPDRIQIVAGVHNRSDPNGVIREVDYIHIHPDWSSSSMERRHDIAMLHLSQPLGLASNPLLARICVPKVQWPNNVETYPSNGTRLAAIGWGNIKQDWTNNSPDNLHQVQVFAIDNNDPICNKSLFDTQVQFCAALYEGGKDTCQGDSGGPILQWLGDQWEQVGITSFGKGCALKGDPGIYTRLAYYHEWIDTIAEEPEKPTSMTYTCDNTLVSCGCGYNYVQLTSSRIVGGEEALPNSWTMIVSLRQTSTNRHFCGGSILSDSYILTAAHCIDTDSPGDVIVAAGMHNKSDENAVIRRVDQIFVHPNWSQPEYLNDIAILRLSEPLELAQNSMLTRTCIPHVHWPTDIQDYPSSGTPLATIGWGHTEMDNHTSSPDNLHQVQVFSIDNNDPNCTRSLYNKEIQFCAGLSQGGKDTCQDDSGGPIFQWLGNRWEQ